MPRMRARAIIASLPYALKKADVFETGLYYITDNLYYTGQGKRLTIRFHDLISENYKKAEKDERTGDEIAADVINRMGLKL